MNPHITHSSRSCTDPDLPVTVALEALSNDWRRRTLALLSGQEAMTVDELAETLAFESGDLPADTLRLELHHCHLPKLADAGLVRYDAEQDRVRPRKHLTEFDSLLESLRASDGVT